MRFRSHTLNLIKVETGIFELRFCAPHPVNTLDTVTLKSLDKVLKVIQNIRDLKGLILTSDKTHFIVGADINEFLALFQQSKEELDQWIQFANNIFNNLAFFGLFPDNDFIAHCFSLLVCFIKSVL